MELTQRLECTQELYSNNCAKSVPEQIGFLGICGSKYPLKKGPNKIGRDPETCNIVLNLNSISRQHAVINILNSRDFMLMDLDSANKTKLSDKILQPYIPQLLKNGDMVQFGDVFGVFRLLQEENDLPMTQAMDIPETPVHNRHISKLNVHATTIPESPEVSDKDDSYIATSQQKPKNVFKSPNNNFLKASGKTIAIKPVGTNKIDNVFWSSSKKSDSFSTQTNISGDLDDSVELTQNSQSFANEKSIHEMETQNPFANQIESINSLYNAYNELFNRSSPNIYEMETQLPIVEYLPEECKIHVQENLQININTDNKENDDFYIHNAETQVLRADKPSLSKDKIISPESKLTVDVKDIAPIVNENVANESKLSSPKSVSDDIILFDEIDCQPLEDNIESQQLLLSPILKNRKQTNDDDDDQTIPQSQINFVPQKRTNRIESDSSTDCEDINVAATQLISKVKNTDENLTDCEDETDAILIETNKSKRKSPDIDEDSTDCEDFHEDDLIEPNKVVDKENIEDLPTQVLGDATVKKVTTKMISKHENFEDLPTQIVEENINRDSELKTNFPDLLTQVLVVEPEKATCLEEALTQKKYSDEIVQFKMPFKSPVKIKKKVDTNITPSKSNAVTEIEDDDDEKYYAATQELFDDLCSQRPASPDVKIVNIDKNQSMRDKINGVQTIRTSSSGSSDVEEKITEYVSNLTSSQIEDVVGVQKDDIVLKKMPSDGSDVVATPKKINCISLLETDLPNTQEIKTGISLVRHSDTESFTDNYSDSERDSERDSPIKFKHKSKVIQKIRINLSDKFDPETIPVRTSIRIRKPTTKIQNCDESFQLIADKILKPVSIKKQDVTVKNGAKKNYHKNTEIDDSNKKQSKRGRKAKQNDETMINKEIPKMTETATDECNSNNTGRRSRIKHKQEETRKKTSRNKGSKTPEEEISTLDIKNKNNAKLTKQLPVFSENENKTTITKERSKSPEMGIKKKPSTRERFKSPEHERKRKTSKENSRSPEIGIKKKSIKPRSRSSDEETKKNTSKETGKNLKTSEKSVTLKSEETKIRRSKRNRTKKSAEPVNISEPKPAKHEQSRVYSTVSIMSSDSSTDSPNKLKRPATGDLDLPNAKKPRSGVKSILRATPARKPKTQYVLFTAFACDEVKEKLEKLGAIIVSDVMTCTVVLTMQIKRTFKLLCAVGLGKPIVGPNWVQACADTNMVVDPWLYLLQDEVTERRFKFNLQQSLVGRREFLKGYNLSSTPSVMPSTPEMKLIVECSGGKWKEGGPRWICVSTKADRALWPGLKRKGAVVVSTEFILGGVMRQTIDIEKNML
ncbi:mediator of DNA damage checkpoint protein 1-like isoform X2 [Pararge aegeria]|uniref:mediator of DNA damage checkpoint protein 1-like isoform X2 n=1 Tax=Pararge aegeria TaxID=116150 RepID=UPI0019D2757C|nr:mediator of DNA damage checkpoint protein 1-like isoform X2 [Pararge aegeria]